MTKSANFFLTYTTNHLNYKNIDGRLIGSVTV